MHTHHLLRSSGHAASLGLGPHDPSAAVGAQAASTAGVASAPWSGGSHGSMTFSRGPVIRARRPVCAWLWRRKSFILVPGFCLCFYASRDSQLFDAVGPLWCLPSSSAAASGAVVGRPPPRAGGALGTCLACLPWPAPRFSACECALSQRQAGLSSCPPPPTLNGQGRPLLLRYFVPRLKSPLYMPLARPQPVIQVGPRGSGEEEHWGVSWPGPQGRGPPGSQAARAPPAAASDLRPFQPRLEDTSKRVLHVPPCLRVWTRQTTRSLACSCVCISPL